MTPQEVEKQIEAHISNYFQLDMLPTRAGALAKKLLGVVNASYMHREEVYELAGVDALSVVLEIDEHFRRFEVGLNHDEWWERLRPAIVKSVVSRNKDKAQTGQ